MEELKQEQEMRERRNHDREQWRDGRPSEISAVIDFISFCVYNVERVLWDDIAVSVISKGLVFTIDNIILKERVIKCTIFMR